MAWLYLTIGGVLEITWPLGLKLAQTANYRLWGIILAAIGISASGIFLFLAQKQIPIGTAYAIWTGIGCAGTFVVGVVLFDDTGNFVRCLGVLLIICGIAVLKLAH